MVSGACSGSGVRCVRRARESATKPVGKPDAGNPHVRFDERGWETERRPNVSTRAHPRLYRLPVGYARTEVQWRTDYFTDLPLAIAQASGVSHSTILPVHDYFPAQNSLSAFEYRSLTVTARNEVPCYQQTLPSRARKQPVVCAAFAKV